MLLIPLLTLLQALACECVPHAGFRIGSHPHRKRGFHVEPFTIESGDPTRPTVVTFPGQRGVPTLSRRNTVAPVKQDAPTPVPEEAPPAPKDTSPVPQDALIPVPQRSPTSVPQDAPTPVPQEPQTPESEHTPEPQDAPTPGAQDPPTPESGGLPRRDESGLTFYVAVAKRDPASETLHIFAKPSGRPDTGTIVTSLELGGRQTVLPFLTSAIPAPQTLLQPMQAPPPAEAMADPQQMDAGAASPGGNIFDYPVGTQPPPRTIPTTNKHPANKLGVKGLGPAHTNKFYANFFLGNQGAPNYCVPYSLSWAKGLGAAMSWGLAISHTDADQRVFGPRESTGAVKYFINPVGIQSMILSAAELGRDTTLTTSNLGQFSVTVMLSPNAKAAPVITFPLVLGSAFTTAVYDGAKPVIQTGVFFRTVVRAGGNPKPGIMKYRFTLEDGRAWLLYAYSPKGDILDLEVTSNNNARAKSAFRGVIQVAKDTGGSEALYDEACGVWATSINVSGSVSGPRGTYTFTFAKAGLTQSTLLMYALPHHVESFDGPTRKSVKSLKIQTQTKGLAVAVCADKWTMVEPQMPINMGFAPWSPDRGPISTLSVAAKAAVQNIAVSEVSQNMDEQTNLDSMYFSGKAFAKFALIIYTLHDVLGNQQLANSGLAKLKTAFARFVSNSQKFPLTYETVWGGVVSTGSYKTGNTGEDFGNTYYNDHHFHWGYFILTAAIIGRLDPSWIPANKDWVNTLVRDVANPSTRDPFFPVCRSFDWFAGHSWAHGLFESLDGKDQESSSEDAMHVYAIKMWGNVVGDKNMEARANLNLAVLARALGHYYLYTKSNVDQPSNFIGNKVAGILFENKIDHTTFFGNNVEFIQGIHMLPLLPCSNYMRSKQFVKEEWDAYFSNGRVDKIDNAWKGVIYANYAAVDPKAAFAFFSARGFNPNWVDGGASLTWYLAFCGALAGL